MERQILSLKKKKVLLVWNIYINDGMAKDLTDLSDFKITFIIIIYSLSLLLITNCNKERKKEGSPQASHPGNWALVAALFFPATSCLSTHRLFPAGTEQTVSSGLCLSVCMVFLMGAFRGTELPFAEHPQQTLGSEPFRPDYIRETPPHFPLVSPLHYLPAPTLSARAGPVGSLGRPTSPTALLLPLAPTGGEGSGPFCHQLTCGHRQVSPLLRCSLREQCPNLVLLMFCVLPGLCSESPSLKLGEKPCPKQ